MTEKEIFEMDVDIERIDTDFGDIEYSKQVKNPVTQNVGTYSAQFESIRQIVYQDVQKSGAIYCMNVQKLVKACISSNLEIYNLAKLHALQIQQHFKNQTANLMNHTITNAMYDLDGKAFLVEFDLSNPTQSIVAAKHMQEVKFNNHFDCLAESLLARQCQVLMASPISDELAIKYEQLQNSVTSSRTELAKSQQLLKETIIRRAFTAFDFKIDMSFYTLNFSSDLSMLFWDRYTIVDITAKSYYVEQHCIVEHVVTGDIEIERFIALHKPSKNSMALFLSQELACLTEMIRPQPTSKRKEFLAEFHERNYRIEEPETNDE